MLFTSAASKDDAAVFIGRVKDRCKPCARNEEGRVGFGWVGSSGPTAITQRTSLRTQLQLTALGGGAQDWTARDS